VGVENTQVKGRVLLRGERVHVAAHGVHVHGDLLGAAGGRAFEDEVLDEVGEAAFGVGFVAGAAADEDADRDGMHLGQRFDEERQTILKDVPDNAHNQSAYRRVAAAPQAGSGHSKVRLEPMISVDEARAAVLGRAPLLATERAPLAAAWSRVLRVAAVSDRDQPPFPRAAMDGFALRFTDAARPGARLRIAGEIRAGVWPDRAVGAGEAIRIMTGAPLPEGADAVIQVERTKVMKDEVLVETVVTEGQNIVPRGSEARAGAVVVGEGVRITAAHLAVLASVGAVEPVVSRRPRVAVIVTGDEVVDPSAPPGPAQIRNANGPALLAAIREAGGEGTDFGVVPDDPATTRAAIQRALNEGHDAIVLSGGVSAGDFDFVEGALGQLGFTLHVTAVRVKPGAPFVFGTRGHTLVFGLPGNPVSAQVTFELFARPALLKMQGAIALDRPRLEAELDGALMNKSNRRNYLPVRVTRAGDGLHAQPIPTQGSGDTAAHSLAHALAVLEPERTSAAAGERVTLYPLLSFLEV